MTETLVETTLARAADKYRGNRESTEALSDFLTAFYGNFAAQLVRSNRSLSTSDLQLPPTCPFTPTDLYNFRQRPYPDMGFFLPKILADKAGLVFLETGFPNMSIYVQKGGSYTHQTDGWVFTESGLFTPNHGTTQAEAERILGERSRLGLTPNLFIAFSGAIKELEGRFIDEQSISRLLGFVVEGGAAHASFYRNGSCFVYCRWNPGDRDQNLGARSLGVKS